MPIGRNEEPNGSHVILDLNEYEASVVCGALAKYGHDMLRQVALVAAMGEPEKAKQIKDLLTPELDRVQHMLETLTDKEAYTSGSFDIADIKKQREEFELAAQHIEFILTDGEKGVCPPGAVVAVPEGTEGSTDGKVIQFSAFQKKKLH